MAIEVFNGLPVSGKRLKVAWSRPGKRPACNLCVRNIPLHWRTEDLKRRFQIFGTLLGCRVLWDSKRNLNRAIGFVRYDLPEDARSAFAMMNGVLPVDGISKIKVEIAYRDQIYNPNTASSSYQHSVARSHASFPRYTLSLSPEREKFTPEGGSSNGSCQSIATKWTATSGACVA